MNKLLLLIPFAITLLLLHQSTKKDQAQFKEFSKEFLVLLSESKVNISSKNDLIYRHKVFLDTKKFIEREQPSKSYQMGVNVYSVFTWEEFQAKFLGKSMENKNFGVEEESLEKTKEYLKQQNLKFVVNWVGSLDFSPVRLNNTQNCPNPYYAVSSAQLIEAWVAKTTGNKISFSAQELLDCSTDNFSCSGGWPNKSLIYIQQNKLSQLVDYPDVFMKQNCMARKPQGIPPFNIWNIKGRQNIITAMNNNPVILGIEFEQAMMSYKSGTYYGSDNCGKNVSMFVLASGYQLDKGASNYLLKFSLGTTFGDNGYLVIDMNKSCGIESNEFNQTVY